MNPICRLLGLSWLVSISGMTACSSARAPDGGLPDGGLPDGGPSYFHATGNMTTARYGHTATLLSNGKVLVAGGMASCDWIYCYGSPAASAELYDPVSDTFSATGNMTTGRVDHTATLLPNGKVLLAAGGYYGGASAELYDPATGMFSAAGNMTTAGFSHTATLLLNGKVLLAGGAIQDYDRDVPPLASAELYDPVSDTFSATGNMTTGRVDHTATLLPNGKVLLAGGGYLDASAELYDPATSTFSATGNMTTGRVNHTATLLLNGKVLVTGFGNAELYDPATGMFSPAGNMTTGRYNHTATPLLNGKVLLAGGWFVALPGAELYDPATGTFSLTGKMTKQRSKHTATRLLSGKVILAGGSLDVRACCPAQDDPASAELFDGP